MERSLRRIKPEKQTRRLRLRERSELLFLKDLRASFPKLLLDTTVYIDTLQNVQPDEVTLSLRVADLWHSTVTEAELSALAGLLKPDSADTANILMQVTAVIERRPGHRILNPDREIWRDAGILAGLLARLQGYGKGEQRKALNDALIFLTAIKHGCAIVTRNISDFDLLQQLDSRGTVLFYDRR